MSSGPLAERLRSETRALHAAAERSAFMAELLRGRLGRPAYCALLRNLHAVYAALEPALERHACHPAIEPVYLPALWRAASLESDLNALHGTGWREAYRLLPAMARYAARLLELDRTQPALLLAHAYVRYLGDLSGGQILRKVVAASLASPGSGTAFYDFGNAAETAALTKCFRQGLEGTALDDATADAVLAEARFAFELHCALFDELAAPRTQAA